MVHARLVVRWRLHAAGPGGNGTGGIAGPLGTQWGQVGPQTCCLCGVHLGLNLARQSDQHDNAELPVHAQLLERSTC